jgi:hypothetical protein
VLEIRPGRLVESGGSPHGAAAHPTRKLRKFGAQALVLRKIRRVFVLPRLGKRRENPANPCTDAVKNRRFLALIPPFFGGAVKIAVRRSLAECFT